MEKSLFDDFFCSLAFHMENAHIISFINEETIVCFVNFSQRNELVSFLSSMVTLKLLYGDNEATVK